MTTAVLGWLRSLGLAGALLGLVGLLAGCAATPLAPGQPASTPVTKASLDATLTATSPGLVTRADLAACPPSSHAARPVAGGLPAITLTCLGAGPAVTLSGLRGRPAVINVWASWCPPCRAEAPYVQAAYQQLRSSVTFLGITFEDQGDPALRAATSLGLHFPSVQDPEGEVRAAFPRILGPPVTLFVAADGHVTGVQYGQLTSTGQLLSEVHRYLGVSVAGVGG
ncbi:MAG: TlpA family protein disulfide reductase [Actinomycetes bacterium]